jgi:prolyl-tRNA editing enzyme YbaK/EbsC (Cys-tRNA(Pro) deacylase)
MGETETQLLSPIVFLPSLLRKEYRENRNGLMSDEDEDVSEDVSEDEDEDEDEVVVAVVVAAEDEEEDEDEVVVVVVSSDEEVNVEVNVEVTGSLRRNRNNIDDEESMPKLKTAKTI